MSGTVCKDKLFKEVSFHSKNSSVILNIKRLAILKTVLWLSGCSRYIGQFCLLYFKQFISDRCWYWTKVTMHDRLICVHLLQNTGWGYVFMYVSKLHFLYLFLVSFWMTFVLALFWSTLNIVLLFKIGFKMTGASEGVHSKILSS